MRGTSCGLVSLSPPKKRFCCLEGTFTVTLAPIPPTVRLPFIVGANAEAQKRYFLPFNQAMLYVRLNDRENTLIWLEKAYNERHRYVTYIGGEPAFDSLREDPRFQDLVKRIGLP